MCPRRRQAVTRTGFPRRLRHKPGIRLSHETNPMSVGDITRCRRIVIGAIEPWATRAEVPVSADHAALGDLLTRGRRSRGAYGLAALSSSHPIGARRSR